MLFCSRLRRAARMAAADSGISTIAATMMPTSFTGAPIAATPAWMKGASALASSTTAPRARSSRTKASAAMRQDGGAGCASSGASSPGGRK